MKTCPECSSASPDGARYCMACGHALGLHPDPEPPAESTWLGMNALALSVVASLVLSLILVLVLRLPIFFIAGFLPMFWQLNRSRNRNKD